MRWSAHCSASSASARARERERPFHLQHATPPLLDTHDQHLPHTPHNAPTTTTQTKRAAGFCKPGTTDAKYGSASLRCPDGFTMEKDKIGLTHCVRRTKQPCPSGTQLGPDGQCCPAEGSCFSTVAGLCPHGYFARSNCSAVSLPKFGKGATATAAAAAQAPAAEEAPAAAPAAAAAAQGPAEEAVVEAPEDDEAFVGGDLESAAVATGAAPSGGSRKLLAGGLFGHMMPDVVVNTEKITPLVVLPKPLISMNVPDFVTEHTPPRLTKQQKPLVILPQPALSFIEPQITVNYPKPQIPKKDMVIPILPTPKVSFFTPEFKTTHGGLNIKHKTLVVDATRLGPKKTYDINIPPVKLPNPHPVTVEVKSGPRTVIDLSQFGPKDATVVKLPNININVSHPVKVIKDEPQVRFVDLGRLQKGPVYEFTLPNLPPKNTLTVNLPKVNMSTIVLPGELAALSFPLLSLACLSCLPCLLACLLADCLLAACLLELPACCSRPRVCRLLSCLHPHPCTRTDAQRADLLPVPLTPKQPPPPKKPTTGHKEKEVVAVNVLPPDAPPTHQIKITIDKTNATLMNLPKPLKITPKGDVTDTRVQVVELPPINVKALPPILTIDMRKNKTFSDKISLKANYTDKDLEVVKYYLPTLPKMGRDVNLTLPRVNLDRYLPAKGPAEDDGKLKTTVTVINATLPSLNHVEALNKPLIKPGQFALGFKKAGKGLSPFGIKVTVEDVLTGGKGKATPLDIGKPLPDDSIVNVLKDAVKSGFDSKQYCKFSCCPVCKPQPETIEYADPVYECEDGCSYDASAGKCVCQKASPLPCPPGKQVCEVAGAGHGLCVDEGAHAKLCLAHGAVCLAQNKVAQCPAA